MRGGALWGFGTANGLPDEEGGVEGEGGRHAAESALKYHPWRPPFPRPLGDPDRTGIHKKVFIKTKYVLRDVLGVSTCAALPTGNVVRFNPRQIFPLILLALGVR